MSSRPISFALNLILILTAGCIPKTAAPTPNFQYQIEQAVAATLIAMPLPTQAPPPTSYPTPTAVSLAGLFCEYKFCIGHPADVAFYDHLAAQNVAAPSGYGNGFLYAYKIPDLILALIWLQAPGTNDPKFLLDTILDDQADVPAGVLEVKLIRDMNVVYTPITTSIPEVPFGGAGAWTCGDRVFAWKAYTQQADTAAALFSDAMARFNCGQ